MGAESGAKRRGVWCGLLAAASFGVSAPLAKLLLGQVTPTLLAGLLYLGAAIALWGVRLFGGASREAALRRADLGPLLGCVILGGIVAPVLMLTGLRSLSALTGSLLLNLEAPFTMVLAVLAFREHLTRRALAGSALILAGALLLRTDAGPSQPAVGDGPLNGTTFGMAAVALACLCWALDNNLTQRLTLRDPFALVRIKTSCAGLVNTALALGPLQASWPAPSVWASALCLGSVSYGASVVLDAYALRYVGAAREAAYFATAPFLGALLALFLFGEPLRAGSLGAMASMLVGVVWMMREQHGHFHQHEALEHEHLHSHDAHHQHEHLHGEPAGEPHSHPHRHAALGHAHEHVSDLHHRHEHS